MAKPPIFLDLDGVLVDFVDGACKLHAINPNFPNHKFWRPELSDSAFWARINSRGSTFWRNLPKYSWADRLVGMCQERAWKVFFLSSVDPRNPQACSGKMGWVRDHYPKLANQVILTKRKCMVARSGRILIDDTFKHCKQWYGWDGSAILFPQPWTRTWEPSYSQGGRVAHLRNKLDSKLKRIYESPDN